MLNPGMILSGRYEIIEVVGAGGMSEVYKAKCHKLNRFVAIKILKTEFSTDVNFVTKFRNEAQSAAGLTHPNIVNVYDVGEDRGIYYIVMELVEGITLKEYIQKNGRIKYDQAIDFATQIAQGLEVAHENHTIHRDIKPQNIIVSNNGTLKVTDFGIARASSSNTMTSNAMGSVHYISPEQARGGYSDERSDIYSLGITMYEMVTGHVPFEGENNVAVALMHIQNEMISPREYYPDIPSSFEKVILKCTQKKPERRYLTANALIADLKRVKENPNIDSIVVPPVVNNSPTVEMTSAEMEAIKQGRQMNQGIVPPVVTPKAPVNSVQAPVKPAAPVNVPPVKKDAFDDLFPEDLDEYYDDYEEEDDQDDVAPVRRTTSMEAEDELDPKLKKIIMISSIAVVAIIAILIILIIGKIAGWNLFGGGSEKKNKVTTEESSDTTEEVKEEAMVNVVGLYKTAAEEELKRKGFTNYKFVEKKDDTVEEGYVISQSVDPETTIPVDSEIEIAISSGKEMTTVPDVVNYTDEQAQTLLKEAKLDVTHGYEYSDDVEKDHVIKQEPAAGEEVPEGTKVKIIVSNGKETKNVLVPSVKDLSEADAKAALESAKLSCNVTYDFSDTVDAGKVISQSVDANTEVEEGTTVSIVVSNGKEQHTYSVSFSGKVKNIDYDFDTFGNVNVQISYTIDGQTYSIYSGAAGPDTFPLSISGSPEISGQKSNSGSFSIVISDVDGIDVTSSFNTSGLSASFSEE